MQDNLPNNPLCVFYTCRNSLSEEVVESYKSYAENLGFEVLDTLDFTTSVTYKMKFQVKERCFDILSLAHQTQSNRFYLFSDDFEGIERAIKKRGMDLLLKDVTLKNISYLDDEFSKLKNYEDPQQIDLIDYLEWCEELEDEGDDDNNKS